jgi:hypothetical protein
MSYLAKLLIFPVLLAVPALSADTQTPKDRAQALAHIGSNQLHLARLAEAQTNCDEALKLDPANALAKSCLDLAAKMSVDQDLNTASAKLRNGDRNAARTLASKWLHGSATDAQRQRAETLLKAANQATLSDLWNSLVPDWLRQTLVAVAALTALTLILLILRTLWREWKRGEWYGNLTNTTRWKMFPLQEIPGGAANPTCIATDALLDALARVGHELRQPLWAPHLLLLRPTPPANYEPAVISEFLSQNQSPIVMSPPAEDLCLEWNLHDVRLDEAVQNLQLKAISGVDVGSIVRFLLSVVRWFNAGSPQISGTAHTTDKSVAIHVAAHGGRIKSAAVTASTDLAPGLDAIDLTAERVAFKFLFRMRYPDMTNDQIDGFAALRQGASLFGQYASTVPGAGEAAKARSSSLAKAAFDLSFFRASIPAHCGARVARDSRTSLEITDDVRQAALLAEGVAYSLTDSQEARMNAIDCFRQLQDWPGLSEATSLRQQAAYNEALVWAQSGSLARAVLMLTELLGERAPDTVVDSGDSPLPLHESKPTLPPSISLPARVARVAAFARYPRSSWSSVPVCRVELIVNDAEQLIADLDKVCKQSDTPARDRRLLRYFYLETLRSLGHLELMRVINGSASSLYENKRPTGLRQSKVDADTRSRLFRALRYLRTCEELSPTSELYCDLAECYLLLRDFTRAAGYARHAILESNVPSERAYYIAAESFLLNHSLDLAKTYAEKFPADAVKLDEFKSLRSELGLDQPAVGAAARAA